MAQKRTFLDSNFFFFYRKKCDYDGVKMVFKLNKLEKQKWSSGISFDKTAIRSKKTVNCFNSGDSCRKKKDSCLTETDSLRNRMAIFRERKGSCLTAMAIICD